MLFKNIYLFRLCWVSVSGFSSCDARTSLAVTCQLICPMALEILVCRPRIGPASLHWEADSLPLDHQGSPLRTVYVSRYNHLWKRISCFFEEAQLQSRTGDLYFRIPVATPLTVIAFFHRILLGWWQSAFTYCRGKCSRGQPHPPALWSTSHN